MCWCINYIVDIFKVVDLEKSFFLGREITDNKEAAGLFIKNATNPKVETIYYPDIRIDSCLGDLSFQLIDLNIEQSLLKSEPTF